MKKWAAELLEMADKQCCEAGAKRRGDKSKLPPGSRSEITITAPAPFYLSKTYKNFIKKSRLLKNFL
jgi:hypothetical protein